jgi:hypothetical protein
VTTAEGPISSPTDELTGKLNRTKDIEKWLKKIDLLLDAARRCSIEVDNANYKSAYKKFYTKGEGTGEYDIDGAYIDLLNVNNALTDALVKEKWHGIPSLKYFSFQSMIYGWTPIAIALLYAVTTIFVLLKYQGLQPNHPLIALQLIGLHLTLPQDLLGIPLWAAFFGCLGACNQILIGVVADIREDGVVSDYKRIWYIVLPLVALIFGYLAYIIIDLGLISVGGTQSSSFTATNITLLHATGANSLNGSAASFDAKNVTNLVASGVGSFSANMGIEARMLACFLAGYATDAFIKRLTGISNKM